MENQTQSQKVADIISSAGVTIQSSLKEKEDKRERLSKNKGKLLDYIRSNVIGSNSDTTL